MDYHDSSAGNARLAVVKYAATSPKKIGTVFFNPGDKIAPSSIVFPLIREFLQVDLVPQESRPLRYLARNLVNFLVVSMTLSPGIPAGLAIQREFTFGTARCNSPTAATFSPGPVYCFNTGKENAEFWQNTVASFINETISEKFNQRDLDELYSRADATEQKYEAFAARCLNGPSGPYLKYLGTSSTVRDLVSLGDAIVGQGQPIDYWGVSYGTFVGFNFLNSKSSGLLILLPN